MRKIPKFQFHLQFIRLNELKCSSRNCDGFYLVTNCDYHERLFSAVLTSSGFNFHRTCYSRPLIVVRLSTTSLHHVRIVPNDRFPSSGAQLVRETLILPLLLRFNFIFDVSVHIDPIISRLLSTVAFLTSQLWRTYVVFIVCLLIFSG